MLLILNEGLEKQYEKVKSLESPKSFAKKNIRFNGKKYKNYKKHERRKLYSANLLKEQR